MKNLHLIPIDKPSRLFLNKVNNKLLLDSDTYCDLIRRLPSSNYQNLYITNSEDIKEGDWFMSDFNSFPIHNIKELSERGGTLGWKQKDLKNNLKIILTTDQDLIKDGVQAIDDEFLEWFIKNPSCEYVEVLTDSYLMQEIFELKLQNGIFKYKIIIPKQESKQELNLNCFDCNKSLQDCTCMEDTINMTDPLEQAAKEYAERHLDVSGNLGKYLVKAVFQDGVKWEQEQDKNKYSEEEVRKLFKQYKEEFSIYRNQQILNVEFEEWFEQFKKK